MNKYTRRGTWLAGAAAVALCASSGAAAQTAIATAAEAAPTVASELVVPGSIAYRNRTAEAAPVLEYGLDYFQRFEPLTVGDALKRVPSVTFLSDVLESDGARLRGLDPAYTQVLINGERVPGSGVDRSFFVDRIPAELIERVEVVRSPSANRSGDAVAGALNIVLRDAYALDGGFVRAGGLFFDDKRIRESLGAVWGGAIGDARLLLGGNIQGRRNPKQKQSFRYDEPPAGASTFVNREDQSDLRNGTDYSANGSLVAPLGGGELTLDGFYVRTDRTETERSLEFDVAEGGSLAPVSERGGNLETITDQLEDIKQENLTLRGGYTIEAGGGETRLRFGYASFKEDTTGTEEGTDYTDDPAVFEGARTLTDIDDEELSARFEHSRDLGFARMEFGVHWQRKERDTNITEAEQEFDLPGSPDPYEDFEDVTGGVNQLEETRIDPYLMFSGNGGPLTWEVGLRWETTKTEISDATAPANADRGSRKYDVPLPSAHFKWNASPDDRFSLSFARTIRRPGFDQLSPALLEEEVGDNDLLGNPELLPEKAWGVDFGYERRLGPVGVVGINFFYRDVTDLIELASTGEEGSEGEGAFVLQPRNTGSGHVKGVEFDLSTPLTVVNLPDTGVFLNLSYMDSKVRDEFGKRRFNNQPEYVFNAGFIQDLPDFGAAFGATYRKQGAAFGRVIGEEVRTSYGADLEVFVEKRIGKSLTLRFTGSNLLDSSKDELFHKFDSAGDQRGRDYDEYEVETEKAGPVFQLIARMAF